MNLLLLLIASVPLPTAEQHMMLYKQEKLSCHPEMTGDYWEEGHSYDVLDYDIQMTVDIPADSVWAEVTITLKALSDTVTSIPLNFHQAYTIDEIKEGGDLLEWNPVSRDTFRIFLDRQVEESETLSVTVSYHGLPAERDGLYIGEKDTVTSVTFTNSEPQGARHWIPCYDHPSDKATFTQHLTVPAGFELVANGTLESVEKSGDWWTYTWKEHYPQPTYLIAFAASKYFVTHDTFAVVEGTEVPMRLWLLETRDVESKFEQTPHIMEYYSEIFPPYPFADEKYDQAHAPIGGAMENTTCTFFDTSLGWGEDWSYVVAHEMSHHWWGDWLTCATWADLWLNEGFATHCEALWWEELFGEEGYIAYAKHTMDIYLEYGQPHPLYDPPWQDLFGFTTYNKGGSVLHMMRQVLGDSVYFAGLNTYAWENADEAVITDDFQEVMEEVSGEDLEWFFDQWVYGGGHPRYEIGWRPVTHLSSENPIPAHEIEFAIAQTQYQLINYFPFRMPLEIGIYVGGTENLFTVADSIGYQRFTLEVEGEPDSFLLDPYHKVLCEKKYHDDIDDVPHVDVEENAPDRSTSPSLAVAPLFDDVLRIRYTQQGNKPYVVSLYDASGRRVRSFHQGSSSNFYRIYPLAELASGVYFVHVLIEGSDLLVAKTVKVR